MQAKKLSSQQEVIKQKTKQDSLFYQIPPFLSMAKPHPNLVLDQVLTFDLNNDLNMTLRTVLISMTLLHTLQILCLYMNVCKCVFWTT